MVVDGPPEVADTLRAEADRLATSIVPSVTPDDAALVRSLLDDAGVSDCLHHRPRRRPKRRC